MKTILFKLGVTLLLVMMFSHDSIAQKAAINQVEISDAKVVVHYNLEGTSSNQQFRISLLSSYDNFVKPLNFVKGDVGVDVSSGSDKKIVWDITKELGNYKGNLTFELRARVYVPFVRLTQFEEGKVFKRGKGYPITWTSGNKSGNVDIEIINKNQESVVNDNNLPNTGQYQLYIPGSIKKGTYILKFTNVKDRSDVTVSPSFTIKPKVPFVFKMLGIAVVGGGVAVAIMSGGSSEPGPAELTPLAGFPGKPN